MKVIVPPIKSQGIKTKLVPWINDAVKRSGISLESNWIEPFFGTGVVGFNSPLRGRHIVGDTNPHIINFYKAVQTGEITAASMRLYLERESRLLSAAAEDGYAYYKEVRDRFNAKHSPYDFLFLSRAGFNGMMRFNRHGDWNVPFCKKPERFAQAYITKICNQICNIKHVMSRSLWEFRNDTFAKTIADAGSGDLIYCDPPYFGRYVDYYNGWTETDERQLYKALRQTRALFILSTWHHNEFRKNTMMERFWKDFNVETKEHYYHSGGHIENRHSMTEALVFNFDLKAKAAEPRKNAVQLELFTAG